MLVDRVCLTCGIAFKAEARFLVSDHDDLRTKARAAGLIEQPPMSAEHAAIYHGDIDGDAGL